MTEHEVGGETVLVWWCDDEETPEVQSEAGFYYRFADDTIGTRGEGPFPSVEAALADAAA